MTSCPPQGCAVFRRAALRLIGWLALSGAREAKVKDEFEDFERRIESFLERVGFAKLEHLTGTDGIRAHWDDLHALLSGQLNQLRPSFADGHVLESGLVEASWDWKRGGTHVSVSLYISGAGFSKVHQQLVALSTETTMVRIPYGPGPHGLGDLAVQHHAPESDTIMWVYRNVCVALNGDGPGVELEPIASTIQRFMAAHRVARVAEHLPRVDRVDRSATRIHVGDEWRISFRLGKNVSADSVTTEIDEAIGAGGRHHLESIKRSEGEATYRAVSPGTARVEIHVVDRKTLLSPPLSASVEILPAS